MSVKPISPLRAPMIEDMTVRNFVPDTRREYIRAVKKLAACLNRSPDTATAEELRAFQVHLTETGTRCAKRAASLASDRPGASRSSEWFRVRSRIHSIYEMMDNV